MKTKISTHKYVQEGGIRCPICAATKIHGDGIVPYDSDTAEQILFCSNCNASWTERWKLTGYSNLKKGNVEEAN